MAWTHRTVVVLLAALLATTTDSARAEANPAQQKPQPGRHGPGVPTQAQPKTKSKTKTKTNLKKKKKKKIELPRVRLSQRDRQKIQAAKEQVFEAMLWSLNVYLNSIDMPGVPSGSGGRHPKAAHSSPPASHEHHGGSKEKGR